MSKKQPSLINWNILSSVLKKDEIVKTASKKGMDEKGNMDYVVDRSGDLFTPRKGMEGPYLDKNKKAYYYDPTEGKYYCPYMDMYLRGAPSEWDEKKSSVQDITAFKFACKLEDDVVEGIIIESNFKDAIKEFKNMAKSAGIDHEKIEYTVEPFELDILDTIKTALKADMPKMSLQDVANRLINATMTGHVDEMPADESNKISQLIAQLDILVDTMSKVVGEPLEEEEVIAALNSAAKNKGAELDIGSMGDSGPTEAYLNFDRSRAIAPSKEASSSDLLKEAKKKKKKSSSSSGRKPTNSKLWSRAKSMARSKFKVYPSAYANLWASKWYKQHGGGWRKSGK
jgi:hypothetical protein